MHYLNITDFHNPDEFFMFMSNRIYSLNIQRNNLWTMCKLNNCELTIISLSKILSDYIWENILPRYCMFILNKYDLNYDTKKDLVTRTMHVAFCLRLSKDLLSEKIAEYIETENNNNLCLEGFINFRMKGLLDDLKTILEISIHENYMEDEFNQFTNLMKSITEEQSPIYDVIFLIERNKEFRILNGDGTDITQYCIENYVNNKYKINYYDSIISSVIFISPKKIFLHCSDETFCSSFCELLKGIFSGRVEKY